MTAPEFDENELEAYLDEALPVERMAEIEAALRDHEPLREALQQRSGRRDAGVHSLGSIWRRHRLSCPARHDLGSYLMQVLSEPETDYITFHLTVVGCRACNASVEDLRQTQAVAAAAEVETRRRKYFQSSVGRLPREG